MAPNINEQGVHLFYPTTLGPFLRGGDIDVRSSRLQT